MAYNLETYQQPFWAKSGNFVRGRDPLGVQNSSISVYASLLPGMTNLTLRLRYYGTYLWLLDQYHQLPQDHFFREGPHGQYTFIRRAELIVAFVMATKYPQEQSVIGSQYVSLKLNEIDEKGFYDIQLGADKHKDTPKGSVYWDYTSGALGQYYAGSLIGLGLISQSNGYFYRTDDSGKLLAEAYGMSISKEAAYLFLKRITEGKLYREDIDLLDDIALNKDYRSTPEGAFYMKMLTSNDGVKSKTASNELPSQRRESLQLFMSLLDETSHKTAWLELPITSYKTCLLKPKTEVKEATFGWYYYFLNELAHYSLETVFWGMLEQMDKGSYTVQQFITHISNAVIKENEEQFPSIKNTQLQEFIMKLNEEEFQTLEMVDEIESLVKNHQSVSGISKGILMLLCLYQDNKHKLQEARDYAVNHFLDSKHGNALAIFDIYIQSSQELSFIAFVRKMIHTILNEHTAIAYKKMGNGEKNLLKFVIEDNYLVHIETMTPNFTNPRLKTLHNFTQDLNLVSKDDELTPEGKVLLQELSS